MGTEQETSLAEDIEAAIDALEAGMDEAPASNNDIEAEIRADVAKASDEQESDQVEQDVEAEDDGAPLHSIGHWDEDRIKAYESLPSPEAKQTYYDAVVNLERGYNKKFELLSDGAKEHETIVDLLKPFEADLRVSGQTRADVIRQLVNAQQYLVSDPIGGLTQLVQQFGGQNAQAIVQHLAQQYGVLPKEADKGDAYADPDLIALKQEFNQFRGQTHNVLQQYENNAQAQRLAEAQNQITLFKEATDEHGNLLRPHFDKVEVMMGQLLTAGVATSMEDAYDKAVYADPTIRNDLIKSERESVATKVNEVRKAEVAKSKAASKNPRTQNVAPDNEPAEPDDILASVQKAARQIA